MLGKMKLRVWIEGTIVAAMAMALSFIPAEMANSGFDLSLGLVPLVLYAYRRGVIPGITAGFVWGMLNIILGSAMKNFITVPQIIFEYPFAFSFAGLSGMMSKQIQEALDKQKKRRVMGYIVLGGIIGVLARWFWHFWAGVFVWGVYAPEGMSPYWYSFILNGISALVNMIYVGVVLCVLVKVAPQLFKPKVIHDLTENKK